MADDARRQAEELDFWDGPVTALPHPIGDGWFLVDDGDRQYAVHMADDRPDHAIFRYNEIAVSQAAHDAGLSPALLHHEPGAMVFEHLPDAVQITSGAHMGRLVGLLGQSHLDLAGHLEVPGPMFWVVQQNRRYTRIIIQHGGALAPALTRLMAQNDELEDAVGPIRPVFCHNNLSRAAFLNDGQRIWLVDWSHGGWNDDLYDLASLAIHLELDRVAEDEMLRHYLSITDTGQEQAGRRRFAAWKCAAPLWSSLWCAIGDMFSDGDVDFARQGQGKIDRLAQAMAEFREQ